MFTFRSFQLFTLLTLSSTVFAVVHHVNNISPYLSSKKVVIVKIYAPFPCRPCNNLAPHFREASNNFAQNNDVAFLEINGNNAKSLGIRSYPTVIIYKDGKEILRQTGANWTSASLSQAVTNALQ